MARKPTDVGPDPIKWIERLQDVNGESQFTPLERDIITRGLHRIKRELDVARATTKE